MFKSVLDGKVTCTEMNGLGVKDAKTDSCVFEVYN